MLRISLGLLCFELVFAGVFSGTRALAQSTATLEGTVTDSSGAVAPNVKIVVRNQGTGAERTTQTESNGNYVVPALEPGVYRVEARAEGFQTRVVRDLRVNVGSIVDQNLQLEVGAVTQEVTVTSAPRLTETATVSVGEVVTQRTVQEMPLNGRHLVDLGLLLPGSVVAPTNGFLTSPIHGQGALAFNTAGAREDTTNFMINGINVNDMVQNQMTYQPSIDTVSEFSATNSTFSAEYGRNSGAIVNIATRSGTNDFHGEAFEYFRNEDLDAKDFFIASTAPNPPFKRNQFGGNLGGPIRRDRTFFFATYEADRQAQAVVFNTVVPTNAQRQAVTNATIQNLLKLIPPPNFTDPKGKAFFQGTGSTPVAIDQWTGDVMHKLSDKDSFHGYYAYQKDKRIEPVLQLNNLPGFGDTRPGHRQLLTLNETHLFGPQVVNEFRLGFNRVHITFTPIAQLNSADLGINDGISAPIGIPQISVSGSLNIGGPAGFPQGRGDTVYVASDTLSVLRGGHALKYGGEIRYFQNNNFGRDVGALSFTSIPNFLAGNATSFNINAAGTFSSIRTTGAGLFVQDRYKLRPNVGVELGLRWDVNTTPKELFNRFVVFNPSTGSLVRVGTNGLNQVYQTNNKDVGPRFGIVWDPFKNGKTSVRAGYGLFFDQPVTNAVSPLASNPPFGVPLNANATSTTFVSVSNPIASAAGTPSRSASSIDRNFTNDYVQDWNFNVQREVARDTRLEVGYFGSKGTHLRMGYNQNQFETANGVPVLAGDKQVRPFPAFANITTIISPGNSSYNALWVSVTKRMSRNLQFMGSYSWSHSIDENSLSSQVPTVQDSTNIFNDRGNSDFDARHHFNISYICDFPFRKDRWVQGWELAGTTTLQSGNPVNLIISATSVTGLATRRPNQIASFALAHPDPSLWFNTAAFCTPGIAGCGTSVFGDFGRNVIVGPGFNNFDVSLIKNTKMKERLTVQFRSEFFNVFNHPNFAQPGRTVGSATFGVITATRSSIGDAGSARQIQFALKLMF